ncbi:27022_t:CDS:2, partial [Racocetra persica]
MPGSKQQSQKPPFAFPQATEVNTLQPLITPPTPVPTEVSTPTELGEFASNIVYQMWHVKVTDSTLVGQLSPSSPLSSQPANFSQTASSQFKNFCVQVLLQTQLSNTVVILSLKYVQRFVKSGRSVNFGEEGPEYRLFTIALMLANKFLDDNTFTNKTWSEVTNIPVKEINRIEIAFLECMDFKMYVSGSEYSHWLECLKEYTKTQQQLYVHQRQRSSSDTSKNGSLITAQNQHQTDSRPSKRFVQFNQEAPSYFDSANTTAPVLGQCIMPASQLPAGMQQLSIPAAIGSTTSGIIQPPAIARVHHSYGQSSPSPAQLALRNSYYGSLRDSGGSFHVKRHSMPTMNLQNIIDQVPHQQANQLKPWNVNSLAYHPNTKLDAQQFKQSNSSSYHNVATSSQVTGSQIDTNTYGPYGNINNQRGEPHSRINHQTSTIQYPNVNDSATDAYSGFTKQQDQQKVAESIPSANQQDPSHTLAHHRSMPQLIRSTFPPPIGYANLASQTSDGLIVGKPTVQSSDNIPPTNNQIQSPEQYYSTPPLMYQKELGSRATQPKIGSISTLNIGVSSNPPTPVDIPFNPMIQPTTSFRPVIGNSLANSNNSTSQPPKYGQYYGSVQAQQGMTGGIGGIVLPLVDSNNNNGNASQNIPTKRIEESIINKSNGIAGSFAPVLIAPPGLGLT